MRRIRPTVRRLENLMRENKVGAGIVVTAATAGAIFAFLFRGGPDPTTPPAAPPVRDTLSVSLLHNDNNTTDAVSFTTDVAVNFTPGCLAIAYVVNAAAVSPNEPAITGWTLEDSIAYGSTRRLSVLRNFSAPFGNVTMTYGGQTQTSTVYSFIEACGTDITGTDGSGAVIQSVAATGTGTTITGTLASLEFSGNVFLAGAASIANSSATTPDADFAELSDQGIGSTAASLQTEWAEGEVECIPTFAASTTSAIISIELKAGVVGAGVPEGGIPLTAAWQRFTIRDTSDIEGPDGVDLKDVTGDSLPDVTSAYEQGNSVVECHNPGPGSVTSPWSCVTLATCNGPEDANYGDLDADGAQDILVACQGNQELNILFAPTGAPANRLNAGNWTLVEVTAANTQAYNTAIVAQINGVGGLDIVGGQLETGDAAAVNLCTSATPRTAASWACSTIIPAGLTMNIIAMDIEPDGDIDLVYGDRETIDFPGSDTTNQGIRWLESNGGNPPTWTEHQISAQEGNHRYHSVGDWDGNAALDIGDCQGSAGGASNVGRIWVNSGNWLTWTELLLPVGGFQTDIGTCFDLALVDIDQDGLTDVAISMFDADGALDGVIWLRNFCSEAAPCWKKGLISGDDGDKFDDMIWVDMDNDGDLDLLTSEQDGTVPVTDGLGVVWFRNPL